MTREIITLQSLLNVCKNLGGKACIKAVLPDRTLIALGNYYEYAGDFSLYALQRRERSLLVGESLLKNIDEISASEQSFNPEEMTIFVCDYDCSEEDSDEYYEVNFITVEEDFIYLHCEEPDIAIPLTETECGIIISALEDSCIPTNLVNPIIEKIGSIIGGGLEGSEEDENYDDDDLDDEDEDEDEDYDEDEDNTRLRCKKCGLEFDESEFSNVDEDGNDTCPACGESLCFEEV